MSTNKLINTETLPKCPSCNGTDKTVYLSDRYPIEKCNTCSLLFVNPRPSLSSIRDHFTNEYIETEERVEEHFISYRKASLAREAAIVKKLIPMGGKLLDLGTASGEFLVNFKNSKQWNLMGVEPSKFAAEAARKRTGAEVYDGFLDDQNFADEEFDVITSLDTFCLHSFPVKDIAEFNRILKPNGLLVIEIPGLNFRLLKNTGFLAKLFYGKSVRLNAGVHLFYYNQSTLGALVEKQGFKLISAHPEQSPLYGNFLTRFLNNVYYQTTKAVYKVTGGSLNIVPKELLIYRNTNK